MFVARGRLPRVWARFGAGIRVAVSRESLREARNPWIVLYREVAVVCFDNLLLRGLFLAFSGEGSRKGSAFSLAQGSSGGGTRGGRPPVLGRRVRGAPHESPRRRAQGEEEPG